MDIPYGPHPFGQPINIGVSLSATDVTFDTRSSAPQAITATLDVSGIPPELRGLVSYGVFDDGVLMPIIQNGSYTGYIESAGPSPAPFTFYVGAEPPCPEH